MSVRPLFFGLTRTQIMALVSIGAALITLSLKFIAYVMTGSVGLYSDALEAFVNLGAGIIAFLVITISQMPPDEKHSYGHEKAEYFASGVEGGLILVAALSIVYMAVERFFHRTVLDHLLYGISISMIASVINFVSAFYIGKTAEAHDSITLEANAKHLLTDVWTSIGVSVGLLIVYFLPTEWQLLDPLIAIAVAISIIVTGIDLVRRSIDGFMDAALPVAEINQIEQAIGLVIPENQYFRGLRTRKAGVKRFIEFKLMVPSDLAVQEAHDWCDRIEEAIEVIFPNASVTIHVEPHDAKSGV